MMDVLAAQVREAFVQNLPHGAALDPSDLTGVAYLLKLMRGDPIDDERTRELHELEAATMAIRKLAPKLIPWAEKELAEARKEARTTDLDEFLRRLHPLSEAAEFFMQGSRPRTTHPDHRWHGWATMMRVEITYVCSKAGVVAGFGKATGTGIKIMAALLNKTPAAIVSALRDR